MDSHKIPVHIECVLRADQLISNVESERLVFKKLEKQVGCFENGLFNIIKI